MQLKLSFGVKLRKEKNMRDWNKDLEICNSATSGIWEWVENRYRDGYSGIVTDNNTEVLFPNHCNDGDDGCAWFDDLPNKADRIFITEARQGWTEAIEEIIRLNKLISKIK